ncbi:glycosyltransferase [Qingshengfaniella alkalisoli]|uniref:Glycosyltransferase n=1 Tax=Qingshengfaniella alkalisoli TaxID=2599296 RepID=A0A5B8J895_9RHOB|nr:glycosyltransferase [Qingshengfaniella alkalisoli]QDY70480.1 glycosyltransferase [Qingshengfaniella alkalisoli]
MEILHVIDDLDPAHGGPQSVVVRLAAAQAAHGADVGLASYSPAHIVSQATAGIPGIERVAISVLGAERAWTELICSQAARILSSRIGSSDIVHLHGVWEPLLLRASHLARRKDVPYAISPHGMLDPWSLGQKRAKKSAALKLGFRAMLNNAAFIHTLNQDESRLLAPLQLTAPTRTIPNGIYMEEVDRFARRGHFRSRFPDIGPDPYILFLSRLHPKKGLNVLADAFAMLKQRRPDIRLVVAGPDAGALSSFRTIILAHEIEDAVHVVGPLYGAAKFEALADAACFCLPSYQEGFSVAITEALACATPVVISEQCHFPEVRTIQAGRVLPLSAQAFADGLYDVLADRNKARAMGELGRRFVAENLTWDKIAAQSLAIYESHRSSTHPTATGIVSATN